jgi:peptide methionine sulfoxide reductase MsrA
MTSLGEADIVRSVDYAVAMSSSTVTGPRTRGSSNHWSEDYHQQYLAKNPNGYDCHTATGVACPIGLGVSSTTSPIEMLG